MALLAEREEHTPADSVAAWPGDQTRVGQLLGRVAPGRRRAAQVSTGSVAHAEFLEEGGNGPGACLGGPFLLGRGHTSAERPMAEALDTAEQAAPAPASVAVEQVLADIHVKRRARLPRQGTQSHQLLLCAGAAAAPVVPRQVLQQRQALFEPFQILVPGLNAPSRVERQRTTIVFPGKEGGRLQFFQRRKGQNRARNGNTVGQHKGRESCTRVWVPLSQGLTACLVRRRNENGGREESRLRNQRRSVAGSATRSGAFTPGAAA